MEEALQYLNDMDEYYSAKVRPRFGKRGPSTFSETLKIVREGFKKKLEISNFSKNSAILLGMP